MAKGQREVRLVSWIKHYLPLSIPLVLLLLRYMIQGLGGRVPRECLNIGADMAFTFLAFWMWAAITNAYNGQLVRDIG